VTRTVDERLRLFDQHVKELVEESGSHAAWTVSWTPAGTTTDEPHRESLRSWLLSVRALDNRRDDLYLPSIIKDIESLTESDVTRRRLADLRARHAAAQTSRLGTITGPNGNMTPRDCFDDLAYTEHLHRDAERERRRAEMPPFLWQMVRMMGWDYGAELAEIATWVQAAGREDPTTGPLFAPLPEGD
jgi:hypothetical protein